MQEQDASLSSKKEFTAGSIVASNGIEKFTIEPTNHYFYKLNFVKNGTNCTVHFGEVLSGVNNRKIKNDKLYAFSDGTDEFSILQRGRDQAAVFTSNKGDRHVFLFTGSGFIDSLTRKPMDPNWYKSLKIDESKLFMVGQVMEEVNGRKLIKTSAQTREELKNSRTALTGWAYADSEGYDCNRKCVGETCYDISATFACEESKMSADLWNCCATSHSLGCCEVLGCDCWGVVGSYFSWCTAKAWAPPYSN